MYTKEPWVPYTRNALVYLSSQDYIRARACVNACAGIKTEELELFDGGVGRKGIALERAYAEARGIAQQRDQLLAALKGLLAIAETEIVDPEDVSEITAAQAAIISAESAP